MIRTKTITVSGGGVRLDAALLNIFPSSTRAFIREAISHKQILVNGKASIKGQKLRGGETVTILELAEEADNTVAPDSSVKPKIIYLDDYLIGCDKPVNMPVQPLSRTEMGTLMNGVVVQHPECIALGDRPLMAGALHRIDANTSGLVLIARDSDSFEKLRAQFTAQSVEKTYLAMVEGSVATGGTLENDLTHDPSLPFCKMIDYHHNRLTRAQMTDLKPLHALTNFMPIAHTTIENEERTLLKVTIFTGVTHQIRAQLALAGMHIINDRLYGAFAIENAEGHHLHALSAKFIHPATGEATTITTPYPEWAAALIQK